MERELLLAVHGDDHNNNKIQNEIEQIKKILPLIESVDVLIQNNDVFDIRYSKEIKSSRRLKKIFTDPENTGRNYIVICKN